MLYILPTNPFSIVRVADDIGVVLGGKVIRGFYSIEFAKNYSITNTYTKFKKYLSG